MRCEYAMLQPHARPLRIRALGSISAVVASNIASDSLKAHGLLRNNGIPLVLLELLAEGSRERCKRLSLNPVSFRAWLEFEPKRIIAETAHEEP